MIRMQNNISTNKETDDVTEDAILGQPGSMVKNLDIIKCRQWILQLKTSG